MTDELKELCRVFGCATPGPDVSELDVLGLVFGFCPCKGVSQFRALGYLRTALQDVLSRDGVPDIFRAPDRSGGRDFAHYQLAAMHLTNHGDKMPGYLTKKGVAALTALNAFFERYG